MKHLNGNRTSRFKHNERANDGLYDTRHRLHKETPRKVLLNRAGRSASNPFCAVGDWTKRYSHAILDWVPFTSLSPCASPPQHDAIQHNISKDLTPIWQFCGIAHDAQQERPKADQNTFYYSS